MLDEVVIRLINEVRPLINKSTEVLSPYASTMSFVHNGLRPYKEITMGGDLDLSVTGTMDGDSGRIAVFRGSGGEVIHANGQLLDNTLLPAGSGAMVLLTYNNLHGQLYWACVNATSSQSGGSTPTVQSLDVVSQANTVNNGVVYTHASPVVNNGNWGGTILWAGHLAADGWIGMDSNADVSYKLGMVGFKTTAAMGGYSGFLVSFWLDPYTSKINVLSNGAPISGTNIGYTLGHRIILARTVLGAFQIQDFDNSFFVLYSFDSSLNTQAQLSPVSDINQGGKVSNVVGYKISA